MVPLMFTDILFAYPPFRIACKVAQLDGLIPLKRILPSLEITLQIKIMLYRVCPFWNS